MTIRIAPAAAVLALLFLLACSTGDNVGLLTPEVNSDISGATVSAIDGQSDGTTLAKSIIVNVDEGAVITLADLIRDHGSTLSWYVAAADTATLGSLKVAVDDKLEGVIKLSSAALSGNDNKGTGKIPASKNGRSINLKAVSAADDSH